MSEACNFIKKEALAQVFSCKFYEISKNTFLTEHLWTTASLESYSVCLIAITFYSYNHDNVSFIERINKFHFSCHRYYGFKIIFETVFERYRRSTSLTENFVMAAPVTINFTLDNVGVLDPLLKYKFKNW